MSECPAKLLIGIPTYGLPRPEFSVDSGWDLLFHIGRHHPEIEQVVVQRDVRTYRQEARRGIVEEALEQGCTHILMLDDDHVFTGGDFDKLWEAIRDNLDVHIVAGLYFTRGLPTAPCIFKSSTQGTVPIFHYPEDQLMEVDVVGFGFVLFETSLFRRVNPPWFNLGLGFGEDAAFCTRLQGCGIRVWVHTGVKVGHLLEQPHVITEADYLAVRDSVWKDEGPSRLVPCGYKRGQSLDPGYALAKAPWWAPVSKRWWNRGRRVEGQVRGADALASQGDGSLGE